MLDICVNSSEHFLLEISAQEMTSTLMANAMAGALRKAASENEDQIFILQQASTLLHLLNQIQKTTKKSKTLKMKNS